MSVTPLVTQMPIPASRVAGASPELRLDLKPAGTPSGLLDGAWWPHSDDLQLELPSLVSALDVTWGRITRVTVNPLHWRPLPGQVRVPGHTVKVGWFQAEQDPHKLLLLSYGVGRWDLLVIPPRTSEAAAARLMAAATDPRTRLTASALIAAEGAGSAADAADASAGTS